MRVPIKNLDPIGSAVLTFIGYKQTNIQTDRQAKFIYRCKNPTDAKMLNNKFHGLSKKNSWIFKIFKNRILMEANF